MEKESSYDIIQYRKKIISKLCESRELAKLLGETDTGYPETVIPYKHCFPYEYIPDTISETDRFLNFDISSALDTENNTYQNVTISFFIVCHQNAVRYIENNQEYLWYDIAAHELENIFCGKNVLGIGKTNVTSNDPYSPQKNMKGRLLKFTVKDFNNRLKYGK